MRHDPSEYRTHSAKLIASESAWCAMDFRSEQEEHERAAAFMSGEPGAITGQS